MTREELNTDIDDNISNVVTENGITPEILGTELKTLADYVDEQVSSVLPTSKTSGSITLSGTFQVLPKTINACSFSGGKAYLPNTETIGDEYYVIATSNNIEIRANSSGTSKMFVTFNTFVSSVTLLTNEMYRFTYIGFGSGVGGVTDGYWKAEKLQ